MGLEAYKEKQQIQSLWQTGKNADVILVADGGKTRIQAHRLIVAAGSSYLANIMKNLKEVAVTEVEGSLLKELLSTCYFCRITVNETNMIAVYKAASLLQFIDVLSSLDHHNMKQLSSYNCLQLYKIAEKFSRKVLFETTEKFICAHFIEVCDQKSFMELNAPNLNKLLTLKDLQVPSYEILFIKVITWLNRKYNGKRNKALLQFLPNLKLSSMSPRFLQEQVLPHCKTIEARNIVCEAIIALPESIPPVPPGDVERKRVLVVTDTYGETPKIVEYSFLKQKWNVLAVFHTDIQAFSVTHSNALNSLCFIGGAINFTPKNDASLWSLETMKFKKIAGTKSARHNCSVASINADGGEGGDLIVAGGWRNKNKLAGMERWLCKSGKWQTLVSTEKRRFGASLIVVGNLIYFIGGVNRMLSRVNDLECYNITDKTWSKLAPLQEGRLHCVAMYEDGKLYVMGGGADLIECYDIENNKWKKVCAMNGSSGIKACIRHDNRLFAFGYNMVLTTDTEWRRWKRSKAIKPLNEHIVSAFSISF